jgi:hypothetical protein
MDGGDLFGSSEMTEPSSVPVDPIHTVEQNRGAGHSLAFLLFSAKVKQIRVGQNMTYMGECQQMKKSCKRRLHRGIRVLIGWAKQYLLEEDNFIT